MGTEPMRYAKKQEPVSAAYRAAISAPMDDEPVTEADAEAIARADDEIRAGKFVSHDEILREFGCDTSAARASQRL